MDEIKQGVVVPSKASEKVILASNRRIKIREALSNGTAWFLEAGRLLTEAVREGDYLQLGYENQKDYFTSEFNIGLSTAHNLMDIWELFKNLPIKQVSQAGYTRLTKIIPIVRSLPIEGREEWLEKAITLPNNAFENEIKEAKGKIPSDTCEHEYRLLYICKNCGHRYWADEI